ncbi:MAG: long-chain-acyl-CoA synthetase [Deltaproteobacteria bacterium]|nr:long-chain-acyl-CoA synthetase [Deltaproteobacteria bacterium]
MEISQKELEALERFMDPERIAKYDDDNPGSLGLLLEENAEKVPDTIALYFEDQRITYRELNRGCNRVANHFLSIGAEKGQVCALLMENSVEYLVTMLGLIKTGTVGSLVNPNLRKKSLVHVLKVSNSEFVLVHENLVGAFREIIDDLDIPKENIWVWRNSREKTTPFNDFSAAFEKASAENPPTTRQVLMGDVINHLYTSGTTGMPKAVNIRAKNWVQNGELVFKVTTPCTSDDIIYSPLTLSHAWGMLSLAGALNLGSGFVFRRKFSAAEFWEDVRKNDVTVATYIGEVPRYLFNQPEKSDDADNPLSKIIGLGLKAEIWEKFKERFGIDEIIECYGFSEVKGSIINIAGKVGMIGRILNSAAAAVLKYDTDAGTFERDENGNMIRCTEPGERGVYIINVMDAAAVMNEYTDEQQTEKKLLRDVFEKGDVWFDSGDLFQLHEDGWLSFKDRLGDTFRWKGENVATQEVESILMDFPGVELASVYGVHIQDMSGQAGMAAIIKSRDIEWDWDRFHGFVQENLPSYAIPRFIRFCRQLDMTATFKQKKVDLRKAGFNPDEIEDPLLFWNGANKEYLELERDAYQSINSGKVRI